MSIRNEDRHGLANLTHERVKGLDKIHVPPYLIFGVIILPIIIFIYQRVIVEDEKI